jgi:hypothetical protein
MTDLVTWLRAQLDDDERVARAAADYGDAWRAGDPGVYPSNESQHPGPIVGGVWGDLEDQYAEHIARWDPARVLAEVAAKRVILEKVVPEADGLDVQVEGEFGVGVRDEAEDPYLGDTLVRLLAVPYANRPGYLAEWAPAAAYA